MKYIVSVDPSINFCGVAVHTSKGKLIQYELLKPENKSDDYIVKSYSIVEQIELVMINYSNVQLILEVPTYWSLAGFIARESGSIFKLSFLCGMICGLTGNTVCLTPDKWKGQLPKKVMKNRLKIYYPNTPIIKLDHNILDAIGIGYSYIHKKI